MNRKPSLALGPTSDLVVLAPWKSRIVEAEEAILPASRLALTFRTLHQIRRTARESVEMAAFSDPVERIEQIHSFRLKATAEGMLLSVTYDFGWEPYMRNLWSGEGAGPFLDLLCCHCADYPLTRETPLNQWAEWIRARELVSDYFFSATALSVCDLAALSQAEKAQRDDPLSARGDRKLAGFASKPPSLLAAEVRRDPAMAGLVAKQSLAILTALYRLSRYYGADTGSNSLSADAQTLLRATRSLLEQHAFAGLSPVIEQRFARELSWYRQESPAQRPGHPVAKPPIIDRRNVQRGILSAFDKPAQITHGAALFLTVRDGKDEICSARQSLSTLKLANEAADIPSGGIFRNLAFSFEGMRRLNMPVSLLDTLPTAFREGAEARATQVGDLRAFHPDRWQPLPRNWPAGQNGQVAVSLVDVVIQLRVASGSRVDDIHDKAHPLHAEIDAIARLPGLRLLSVEGLNPVDRDNPGTDHLGLRDGISQPLVAGKKGRDWSDIVAPGALLAGYPNDAGEPSTAHPLLRGGSFLAIRRMPLKPWLFEKLLRDEAVRNCITPEEIATKIVGRRRDGTPVVPHHGPNDFRYDQDAAGALCPRQSHIRRLNPRNDQSGAARLPRISRRGMSFGKAGSAGCGSLFMAYCSDLAEQYEVLLRWINGGNSTRTGDPSPDPLCGVPAERIRRTFRVADGAGVLRIELPEAAGSFVSLSWSLYLFAPPLDFLRRLPAVQDETPVPAVEALPAARPSCPVAGHAATRFAGDPLRDTGRRLVEWLQVSGADASGWRNHLDEPGARERLWHDAIWATIRHDHGGFLDTPAGYLVGSHRLVAEVLRDDGRKFSVREAGRRILPSLGRFHLGLDAFTDTYQQEAGTCNDALRRISEAAAFDAARGHAKAILAGALASSAHPVRMDLLKDLLEPTAALMSPLWFGLPDQRHVWRGVSDWRNPAGTQTLFPGHFWNSSRHAFNPFTSAETARLSELHGRAALAAVTRHVNHTGRLYLKGSVAHALGQDFASYPSNGDVARVLTGAMMGWIATTLGCGSRLLDDWISTSQFARLQLGWSERVIKDAAAARHHFGTAMEHTIGQGPVPENKHRIVAQDGVVLNGHPLTKDRMVVLGLESACAEQAANNIADSHIYFGLTMKGQRPPHGCPARDMALGMLLGVLAAMAETVSARYGEGRLLADISPFT